MEMRSGEAVSVLGKQRHIPRECVVVSAIKAKAEIRALDVIQGIA
jgi:hypothetical protein